MNDLQPPKQEETKQEEIKIDDSIQRIDKTLQINPNVQMKYYDKYGLPEDGKDHSKFVVENIDSLGVTSFEIKA